MRKGIKKWHSKNAEIVQLKKQEAKLTRMCDDLYDRQLILEGFIKDIYSSTKNDQELTIKEEDSRYFRFLEDARIAHLTMSHDRRPISIKKPHELAQEFQFERRRRDNEMMERFNCGCSFH